MCTLPALITLGIIGPTQIIVIVVLIVVLFGGKKIPELMRGMGRGIKEFKDAMNKDYVSDDANETVKQQPASTPAPAPTVEAAKPADETTK